MSERGYFDLRNLIPGYTFLILVAAINFVPILAESRLSDIASIFGGLVALITGPTIGFLISQSWWWFHYKLPMYDWSPVQTLITKFKLKRSKNPKDKRNVLIVYERIHEVIIKESNVKLNKLKEIFPKDYFQE